MPRDEAELIRSDHVFTQHLNAQLPQVISGQFQQRWDAALAYCFRLMVENYGPTHVDATSSGFRLIEAALRLLCDANHGSLHLFTTNYDCLVDVLAGRSDLQFHSHVNPRTAAFEYEWFPLSGESSGDDARRVYVHRLHGCVAWFLDNRAPYGVRALFGADSKLDVDDESILNEMAIKLVGDAQLGNIPACSLAFQEFREALELADVLLVWGHSFKDLEVLRCVIDVAASRRERAYRLVYIDPYLSKQKVLNNMTRTIARVPGFSPIQLDPEHVEWVTQDGFPALLAALRDVLHL